MTHRNWRQSISTVAVCSTLVFSTGASLATADNIPLVKDGNALVVACPDKDAEKLLDCYLETLLLSETDAIVRIPTYDKVENLQGNLNKVKDFLQERADTFNQTQHNLKFRSFEWHSETSEHWLFGFRVGNFSFPNYHS